MAFRQEKIASLIGKIAASFIKSRIGPGTVVSVTGVDVSNDLKKARVLISVFPENEEEEIFASLKKKEKELRDYAKPRLKMKFLPSFEIEMDRGERNRQRLEKIMNEA